MTGASGASGQAGTGGAAGRAGTGAPTLSLLAGGLGSTAPASRFSLPLGAASDGPGKLYVTDENAIRKVDIVTGVVTTIAGVVDQSGSADGTGAEARFSIPNGVASDGAGNLYVADTGNNTIRKIVIATGTVTTLAGTRGGAPNGYAYCSYADGIGGRAGFCTPGGITSDGAGNLYVADSSACTIRKIVIATGEVTTLAGSGGSYGTSADGTGADARFNDPIGIASDGAGNLYVADYGGRTIRKVVVATGDVTTFAGTPGAQGSADGTGRAARIGGPSGVASDGAGNLYVTDSDNNTIRKIVIATGAVTTIAGVASLGMVSSSVDGTGADARFFSPHGVASDGAGHLYVADTENHNVRQVVIASAAVTTIAGAGRPTLADGTGAAARFNNSAGIASDGAGNLYVADTANSAIRKVVIATGAVTTIAGAGWSGSADGTGAAARFNNPEGVASDRAGNLYVADTGNNTIRQVALSTGAVTTLAGAAGQFGSADERRGGSLQRANRHHQRRRGQPLCRRYGQQHHPEDRRRDRSRHHLRGRGIARQRGRDGRRRSFQLPIRHRQRRGRQPLRRRHRQQHRPEDRPLDRGGHDGRGQGGPDRQHRRDRRRRPLQLPVRHRQRRGRQPLRRRHRQRDDPEGRHRIGDLVDCPLVSWSGRRVARYRVRHRRPLHGRSRHHRLRSERRPDRAL